MDDSDGSNSLPEGLRERKRRETAKRIKEAGIRLFIERGYDATTLDDIAVKANISRRTFFYYFKSKDDILLTMQNGMGDIFAAAIRDESNEKRPLDAARDAALKVSALIRTEELLVLDRLMRSSEAVSARSAVTYLNHEKKVFAVLREMWPEPEREARLKWVAIFSIGALRLALEVLDREDGKRPLVELVREAFAVLEAEI